MGKYLNLGNAGFQSIRKSRYVDKSGLIAFVNQTLGTKDSLTCVSRPRRFGKSFAAQMLCAYYDKSCDSERLFRDLEIAQTSDFHRYLNQFYVIYLDITWFLSTIEDINETVKYLQRETIGELKEIFPSIKKERNSLPAVLADVNRLYGQKFIVIIDEWDALFREAKENSKLQEEYIRLLQGLFKSSQTDKVIEGAYMTGILPIKKYGTQSALTDFREYTMIQPKRLAEYVGFTESEVQALCKEYDMDFEEMKSWYDGYSFHRVSSVYSPNSVMEAVKNQEFGTYWTETETYESLKAYISMNLDGLRDEVVFLLGGGRCGISTRKFQNDITSLRNKDDVLTLLVHLGYLAYDSAKGEVFIPNREVADEFKNVVEDKSWGAIGDILLNSYQLLEDTIAGDGEAVAGKIDKIHSENTSILRYNDENSLSCVITLAYFAAQRDYTLIREMPSGKGFADIVFLPKKYTDRPALIVELKWDKSVEGDVGQAKERRYPEVLEKYGGRVLLAEISYDKKSKKHECVIEEHTKVLE
ncbi:MAG: AAA family ATPase [Lachnospiraceae bacterium]|nr:AAA family ATPase [Lachnospiraceae bacterium]